MDVLLIQSYRAGNAVVDRPVNVENFEDVNQWILYLEGKIVAQEKRQSVLENRLIRVIGAAVVIGTIVGRLAEILIAKAG